MSKRPRNLSHIERKPVEAKSRRPANEPRKLSIDVPQTIKPKTAKPEPQTQVKTKPDVSPPSKLPLILFGLIALLGLGATSAALMIHVMTGGTQTEFSEAVLDQELVPVEPAQIPEAGKNETGTAVEAPPEEDGGEDVVDLSTPNIIPTRGDPIIVSRAKSVARQLVKIEGERAKPVAALKLPGEVFSLKDNLGTVSASFAAGVPGSQVGFAFTQADAGDESDDTDSDAATAASDQVDNGTIVHVSTPDDGEPRSSRIVFNREIDAETMVSDVLAAGGFDSDMSKRLEVEVKQQLGIEKLGEQFGIAAVGVSEGDETALYTPVQVALYRDGKFLGALALSDTDSYVAAANPWYGQEPFRSSADEEVGGNQRLLDVIYAAAVRNKLPTTVAGEIIMLLSRAHDLEQKASGTETMQVIYTSKARDRKSGLGRVLYVRIDRGSETPLECFAFQVEPKKPFDCITGQGDGGTTGGMTTPVRGVLDRKFGPGKDPATGKKRMFYGVEWIAPSGTPVVAAYAGEVIFAGSDKRYGLSVKLKHEGGQVTVYAGLKSVMDGMAEGRSVRAGQKLGTVGVAEGAKDARLYFELQRNGQPVDPFGEYQARVEKGGAVEALVHRITYVESGHNCRAKNPLSTAAGLGQFIESTWLRIIRDYRPELVAGKSRAEILELRYDCDIALEMTTNLTRENANYIRARGHAVTPGNLYLAHFLGPGGAAQALGSNPNASVLETFGAAVVKANPFLSGQTNAWLIEWAARKMAGKGKAPVIAPSSPGAAKAQSLAANKDFVKFRDAVLALVN